MITDQRPATLATPIAAGIREIEFASPFDGSAQTFLEKDYRADTEAEAPLVVIYLHGAASHQDQGMTSGIYHGAFDLWHETLSSRGAIYICPEYRGGSWMGPAAEADLGEIIRLVRERYTVGRLILAGGSMGGTSSLIFASRQPHSIDGVIALCPATDPAAMFGSFSEQFITSYGGSPDECPDIYQERRSRDRIANLAKLPIAIVHGAKDVVIPVEHSRTIVQLLQEADGRILYIEQPEGDHDAPINASFGELLDFVSPVPR